MKTLRVGLMTIPILLLAVLISGCATRRIDWAARVGNYTFDQAVTEIGPPDKQARLTDGTVVAEWLTRRGYHEIYPTSGFAYYGHPRYYRPFPPTYLDSDTPDFFLRLTFAPDGRLQSWKKFSR